VNLKCQWCQCQSDCSCPTTSRPLWFKLPPLVPPWARQAFLVDIAATLQSRHGFEATFVELACNTDSDSNNLNAPAPTSGLAAARELQAAGVPLVTICLASSCDRVLCPAGWDSVRQFTAPSGPLYTSASFGEVGPGACAHRIEPLPILRLSPVVPWA
jgi:hypothetical protein